MESNKKVIAVVVTYNRKELLKESIEALLAQEYENFDILIVDNASTDGTKEYIEELLKISKISYENTGANLGGAGGFNYGMKKAIERGYEYVWIMDDDTIPYKDSLKELMNADIVLQGEYGYLSSIAIWKDGTPCKMNGQKICKGWYDEAHFLKNSLIRTYYSTFVSLFLKASVIKEIGFPIKEFFIWGDDVEYTNRISKKYNCYIVGNSQVLHSTNNNEGSNIAKDDENRISRYKYAYRNEVYIAKRNGLKGILRQIAKIIVHILRVLKHSKGHRLKKIGIILGSSFKGIFFNPKVEYVKGQD